MHQRAAPPSAAVASSSSGSKRHQNRAEPIGAGAEIEFGSRSGVHHMLTTLRLPQLSAISSAKDNNTSDLLRRPAITTTVIISPNSLSTKVDGEWGGGVTYHERTAAVGEGRGAGTASRRRETSGAVA
jgi:hypothetical protein